jgi:hypothetical protein
MNYNITNVTTIEKANKNILYLSCTCIITITGSSIKTGDYNEQNR